MKRTILLGSVFMAAILFGAGLTVFADSLAPDKECAGCHELPRGPLYEMTCQTGYKCSEPTPHYVYECWGKCDPGPDLCMCDWYGCADNSFFCD